MAEHTTADIVVAGGGYVGLTFALAVVSAVPGIAITVVEGRPVEALVRDPRASAIAAGARHMLDALGIWNEVEGAAEPILSMIVTDSRLNQVVRPIFLTFDSRETEGTPLAHMLANASLVEALLRAAKAAGVTVIAPDAVVDFSEGGGHFDVRLKSGGSLKTRLLVAADGMRSHLRALAGIRTVSWDYGQSGIVTTIAHERSHEGRAEEHFLPAGPFATLPLHGGHHSSLVWTEPTRLAEALVKGEDDLFEAALIRRLGHRFGKVSLAGPRAAYPLGLMLAREWVRPRFALIGDAAHGIHPIAGQGLNLGFADAAALSEVVVEAMRRGEDHGAVDVLERYQRWRRFDTWKMAALTDVLNRLFSNDVEPLRLLRDTGLGLVDRMPGIKRFLTGEAAGPARGLPRLLKGVAL